MGIKGRFILFVSIVALSIIIIVMGLGYHRAIDLATVTVVNSHAEMAEQLSRSLDRIFTEEIEDIQIYSSSIFWEEFVRAANSRYKNLSPEAVKKTFLDLDEEWKVASGDSSLIKEYLETPMAIRLKRLVQRNSSLAEIFITDIEGGLIASSGRTSDFYQADEEWWQEAFNKGEGGIFIGDVHIDESAGVPSITVAMPLYGEQGSILGICKALVDLKLFLEPLEDFKVGETGHAVLVDGEGYIIFHHGIDPSETKFLNDEEIRIVLGGEKRWLLSESAHLHRERMFVVGAKVKNPYLSGANMDWFVFVDQEAREVFAPAKKLIMQAVVLTPALIISLIFFTYLFTTKFTLPIEKFRNAVLQIGKDSLDRRIVLKTGDEIEELADSFNRMLDKLQETVISKDYVNNIVDSMADILVVMSPDGKIERVNRRALEVLGYSEEELVGKGASSLFREEKGPFKETKLAELFEAGTLKSYEIDYKTKDGKNIPALLSGAVIKDKKGNVINLVCVGKDIVERKKAERKLQRSYVKLKETQAQLIHAEKMDAVGRMASGVAHEVKNPLGIMLQGINYLEEKPSSSGKDEREMLRVMKDSIHRADKIIRALLDFSRFEEFKIKPEDINLIIERALGLVEHRFKIANIKVVRELGKDLRRIAADRGKIEQVLINLFHNSIDALFEGGEVRVRSYHAKVEVIKGVVGNREEDIFRPREEVVVVEVEDTGIGMDEDTKNKIFEPFFTTKGRAKGTGLGLPVAKSIMDIHKGFIDVSSEKGRGTKFTIYFRLYKGG